MGEYTIAIFLLFILWSVFFISQTQERKKIMLFSGLFYVLLLVPLFWLHKLIAGILRFPAHLYINPGYWHNVTTIFNLNNRTGGFSVEDVFFMVFWGGIVALIFELIHRKKSRSQPSIDKYLPLKVFLATYLFLLPIRISPIYLLILPSFFGGLSIFFIRRDLMASSLLTAGIFTLLYFACFGIFNMIFPHFIVDHYSIRALWGINVFFLPLQEVLYSFSFGLMWGATYRVNQV